MREVNDEAARIEDCDACGDPMDENERGARAALVKSGRIPTAGRFTIRGKAANDAEVCPPIVVVTVERDRDDVEAVPPGRTIRCWMVAPAAQTAAAAVRRGDRVRGDGFSYYVIPKGPNRGGIAVQCSAIVAAPAGGAGEEAA